MQHRVTVTFSRLILWGLIFCVSPALAYYPPLQQGDFTAAAGRIHIQVWDPAAGVYKAGDYYYSGEVVLSLFDQGMFFAAIQEGATYKALLATYDPARGWRFHVPAEATGSAVVEKIADGVITYQVMVSGSSEVHYRLYTYDPASGQWQWDSRSFATHPNFVLSQNGVVALGANDGLYFSVYDPFAGAWVGKAISTGYMPLSLKILADGSVKWYEYFDGTSQGWHFYGLRDGVWVESAYTKPRALFVPQAASGSVPFTVYCTDMSLGGTSWSYLFGDGTPPNTDRSPWHTYNPGKYVCSLTINAGTPEQDSYAASVPPRGGSLSCLSILLLD
jgi:hypothetical protein